MESRNKTSQTLKDELKSYGRLGLVLLIALGITASFVVFISVRNVAAAGPEPMLMLVVLALLVGFTSSRYPILFPGTVTGVSVSEALTFFAVITLSPYHASLLAAIDILVAARRLKLKRTFYLLNISNITISFFVAGKIYYSTLGYLLLNPIDEGLGQKLLIFAVPLIAL